MKKADIKQIAEILEDIDELVRQDGLHALPNVPQDVRVREIPALTARIRNILLKG